ncbi:hypothetical protein CAPTEDRAFT_169179 [Capitella teleta]|uniref:DDHD domain-containing protein n=1 Tax=Capitella teleta TaxID=283909 RepID=R7V5A8_CAPTE|nr:hypothetical protein CAPTEDRAFT_169179 [Capitella teleta]|eukprot:ELU13719.1 hypothetical protein CAPTEDRAFT_169179 [Capitella teleta]
MMVPTSLPPTSAPLSNPQMPPPPPMTGFAPSGSSPPVSQPYQPQPQSAAPIMPYIPVQHHWFFCREISERKMWEPFSWDDSFRLEEAFRDGESHFICKWRFILDFIPGATHEMIVATNGGRYDVVLSQRHRHSVYWEEIPTPVRRCSWFFRPDNENRFVPFEEDFSFKLEAEYKKVLATNEWHKRIEFPDGDTVIMHSPQVIVYYPPSATPDQYGTTPDQSRPRVVRRGIEDAVNVDDGEPSRIDHVVFVVHGIGTTCDLQFRNIIDCVNEIRSVSLQMLDSHFKPYQDEGRIGRVEFLPVRWHAALHGDATGVDSKLKAITLPSIVKLRRFTNDTLLDVLFYASPTYAQTIADTVGEELNRLHSLFLSRNPSFQGNFSVAGHSLGSLILFDLLSHQRDPNAPDEQDLPTPKDSLSHSSSASTLDAMLPETDADSTEESLTQLLAQLGLSDYEETFKKEQIDAETLIMCEESDIREMGLPMGPRKKLQGFIKQRKQAEVGEERASEGSGVDSAYDPCYNQRRPLHEVRLMLTHFPPSPHSFSSDPIIRTAHNTSVDIVVGQVGTGVPFVKYPQLDFTPINFFALGSPIAMFLTVRGVESLGEDFKFQTCKGFFNIFHPFDPVAYRLEPVITANCPPKPVLIPHHKGRKRLHLELKDSLARYGTDLKQGIVDSLKYTWKYIHDFANAHRSSAATSSQPSEDEMVNMAMTQMAKEEEDRLETGSIVSSFVEDDNVIGSVNQGRRVDYVLQEKPIESFNDYIFALGSHLCYWESEDTILLMLKETYALHGIAPIKPGSEQRPATMFPRPPGGLNSPMDSNPQGAPPTSVSLQSPPLGMAPAPFNNGNQDNAPPMSAPTSFAPPPLSGFVKQ